MPMELQDYEKIQATIQAVATKVESSEARMYARFDSLEAKLVTRTEYEMWRKVSDDRMSLFEGVMRNFAEQSKVEHDKLSTRIDATNTRLDEADKYAARQFKQNIYAFLSAGGLVGIITVGLTLLVMFHVIP